MGRELKPRQCGVETASGISMLNECIIWTNSVQEIDRYLEIQTDNERKRERETEREGVREMKDSQRCRQIQRERERARGRE